jgi:nitrile hydratase accessory protein
MQTRFEHFAITSMLGQPDAPPRTNGSLCFAFPWERQAFGMAVALARDGYFEWEEFRQEMISEIAEWERTHAPDNPEWHYYERWLAVLERLVAAHISDAITT